MARKPIKTQEIVTQYENAEKNNEKVDKIQEKSNWKNTTTAKDSSVKIK